MAEISVRYGVLVTYNTIVVNNVNATMLEIFSERRCR